MYEKTENSETCLRLKQGYTETGPQPVPHGIATGRREIWVLALQPGLSRMFCSCTVHSYQRPVSRCHVQSMSQEVSFITNGQRKTFTFLQQLRFQLHKKIKTPHSLEMTTNLLQRLSAYISQKRVLNFSQTLLEQGFTTKHVAFHFIPHLFMLRGRFFTRKY